MSDDQTGRILAIVERLEAGQADLVAGQASMGTDLTHLRMDIMARLESGQASMGADLTHLRAEMMARLDRLADNLTAIRDDICHQLRHRRGRAACQRQHPNGIARAK